MEQKSSPAKIKFKVDYLLLGIILLMFLINLAAVYCAIPLTVSHSMSILYKQCFWIVLGLGLLAFLLYFGIDRLFTGINVFYWILLFLLSLLILDKYIDLPLIRPVLGTRAWFQVGNLFSVQPSEFMKIVLIIKIASIIHTHNENKEEDTYLEDIKLFLKVLLYAVPPLILILLEPDTGLPLIIVISLSVMVMISGIHKSWIYLYFLLVGGILTGIIFLFYTNPSLLAKLLGDAYKLNRFYGWLQTENYIASYGSQLYQSLLAVGSSGWTGYGIQAEVVAFAEPQNDFIFAVIAQDFGYLGSCFVVLACMSFDLIILQIAMKYENQREKYMAAGLVGMLIFQQLENIGMIIGLFPITGITLPLISSGGSSLLSYMIPLAILFQMSSENKNRTVH